MKIKLFTVPNIITLCNLLCGCGSIVASLMFCNFRLALILIVASAVCDFFDGFTARLLRQYSDIGVQLDSLADMVSFGVAPAIAMSVLCGAQPSLFGLSEEVCEWLVYLPLVIALLSALRLAKFNIDDTQHEEFEGLPTPAAAIFCLSLAALCEQHNLVIALEWLLLLSVLIAALLVSPIRMFSLKFKSWGLRDRDNRMRYAFLMTSLLLIILCKLYAVPAIIVLYIVISTVRWTFKKN